MPPTSPAKHPPRACLPHMGAEGGELPGILSSRFSFKLARSY